MDTYTATHLVKANKITDISRRGASVLITFADGSSLVLPPSFLEKHDPQRGDFLVEYATGHLDCMAPSDFGELFSPLGEKPKPKPKPKPEPEPEPEPEIYSEIARMDTEANPTLVLPE